MLRLFLYFLASGLAAAVNFASRFVYDIFTSFWLSVILAYFTGMVVNYLLSRKYVFDSYAGATIKKTSLKFVCIALLGLGITLLVSLGVRMCIETYLDLPEHFAKALAHMIGIGIAFFASFFGHKLITFRSTGFSRLLGRFKA